jgi:hypothetical protein
MRKTENFRLGGNLGFLLVGGIAIPLEPHFAMLATLLVTLILEYGVRLRL